MNIFTLETIRKIREGFRKKYGWKNPEVIVEDSEIILYEEEALNEENLYLKQGEKYIIAMDIPYTAGHRTGFAGNPYIKVYEGKSYKQSGKDARISLRYGTYIEHNDGKKDLTLTSSIIKWVVAALKENCTLNKFKGLTVYEAAWKMADEVANQCGVNPIEHIPYDKFVEMFTANNK